MPKQRLYNMDILTGRKASVGYRIMVRPDGKRHIKDDVSNAMLAVDGKLSITADSTEYDNEQKKYRRAEKSQITIKIEDKVVFCGGTDKFVKLLIQNYMREKPETNVLD